MSMVFDIQPNCVTTISKRLGYVVYNPTFETFLFADNNKFNDVIIIGWREKWENSLLFNDINAATLFLSNHRLLRSPVDDIPPYANFMRYTKTEIRAWDVIPITEKMTFPPQPKTLTYYGTSEYRSLEWLNAINVGDQLDTTMNT